MGMLFKMPQYVIIGIIALSCETGCRSVSSCCPRSCAEPRLPIHPQAPRELTKTILPPYRIEPPDVVQIDAISVIPKSPYHLRALDTLLIQVVNALPDAPISGVFAVEPGGNI